MGLSDSPPWWLCVVSDRPQAKGGVGVGAQPCPQVGGRDYLQPHADETQALGGGLLPLPSKFRVPFSQCHSRLMSKTVISVQVRCNLFALNAFGKINVSLTTVFCCIL